jgi:excisionase family DNA binding protein
MRLLTAQEVASILRVPTSRIYDLAREKRIPAIKVGDRQIRFSEAAIQDWLLHQGEQVVSNDLDKESGLDSALVRIFELEKRLNVVESLLHNLREALI